MQGNKKIKLAVSISMFLGFLTACSSSNEYLLLSNEELDVELGQTVSRNIEDYLDTNKIKKDELEKIIKKTRIL